MKYIDAEKLIKAIEEKGLDCSFALKMERLDTLALIDSLQQDKDVLDLCSRVWWEDRGWIMIPPNVTLKGIESLLERVRHKIKWNEENGIEEQEQQEVDLEKEAKRWWKEHLHLNPENQLWMDAHQSVVFARHFYELGLNARKEE